MAASGSPTTEPTDIGRFENPEADSMKTLRLTWTALLLASLVPLLPAAPQSAFGARAMKLDKKSQSKTADAKPELTEAQKDFQRLSAEVTKARMDDYRKQAAAAKKAREEAKKATAEGKKAKAMPAMRMAVDLSAFTKGFLDAAKKYAGTDDAVQFLTYAIGLTKDKAALATITDTLIADQIESDKMADFVASGLSRFSRTLGQDNTNRILEASSRSKSQNVQGAVHYYRGSLALRDKKISDDDKGAAHKELRMAIEIAPEARFAKSAAGILYEAEHLQIGMKAPDIEGNDTDGVAFKLSDYKGKVIMLDFWGDW